MVRALRGRRGSSVALRVERDGAAKPLSFSVTRARIIIPTVTARRKAGLVILKISSFNQGTTSAVSRALIRAEREMGTKLKGIVLDLRGNPGGLLDQAVAVADLFLTDGLIISTRGRHRKSRQVFDASWGEIAAELPLAVLINGKSASAAEIVAAALQDRHRAVVIGSASFGKGTVQTIIGLPNGGELTMTWARMHTPSGAPFRTTASCRRCAPAPTRRRCARCYRRWRATGRAPRRCWPAGCAPTSPPPWTPTARARPARPAPSSRPPT